MRNKDWATNSRRVDRVIVYIRLRPPLPCPAQYARVKFVCSYPVFIPLGARGLGAPIVFGTPISVEVYVDHDGCQSEGGVVNFPKIGRDLVGCTYSPCCAPPRLMIDEWRLLIVEV